jgi:cytoskeleton protein RodZ
MKALHTGVTRRKHMAIEKTKKKKMTPRPAEASQAPLPENGTTGEILRDARLHRKMSLEDVSAVINVRAGLLRAIEEGNIDALPGMTYAQGFVKSYAEHVGLNAADVVQKFRAEHGQNRFASHKLDMPQPMIDGPQPNILIIGIAVILAVVIGLGWVFFSGGEEKVETAAVTIPQAPDVGTVTGIVPVTAEPVRQVLEPAAPAPAAATPAPAPAETAAAPAPVMPPVAPVETTASAPAAPLAQPAAAIATATTEVPAAPAETISIKPVKSRVSVTATEDSWISIRDAKGGVILKRVLRAGETFAVPDQPGVKMWAGNAGGLNFAVDGKNVGTVGARGQIVKAVPLSPKGLMPLALIEDKPASKKPLRNTFQQ